MVYISVDCLYIHPQPELKIINFKIEISEFYDFLPRSSRPYFRNKINKKFIKKLRIKILARNIRSAALAPQHILNSASTCRDKTSRSR